MGKRESTTQVIKSSTSVGTVQSPEHSTVKEAWHTRARSFVNHALNQLSQNSSARATVHFICDGSLASSLYRDAHTRPNIEGNQHRCALPPPT
eukprot:6464010-Amphidinium_carterae.1